MRNVVLILTILGVVFFALTTPGATERSESSAGFSGRISTGAGFMTSTDQLKTTDENQLIDSLSGNADRYDSILPLALFRLQYSFAESGRVLYLGTPSETGGSPALSLGLVQPLSGGGRLDVSVFSDPFSRNYALFGMFTRSNLFGQDHLFGTLVAGYQYRDANIGFLDAQTFFSGAMIGIEF